MCTCKKVHFQISSRCCENGLRAIQKADIQIYSQGQILTEVQGKMSRRRELLLLMSEEVAMTYGVAALPGWEVSPEAAFDCFMTTL